MSRWPYFLLAAPLVFFVSPALHAQHGGGGGHFSSGGISGHSLGHSMGHSFGHIFGHSSRGHGSRPGKAPGSRGDELPPLAGTAFLHGHVVMLPGPASGIAEDWQPPQPGFRRFAAVAGPRKPFRARHFDGGFCDPFRFTWHSFLFPDDFDCFVAPFFVMPGLGASYESDKSSTALDSSEPAAQNHPLASHLGVESSPGSPVETQPPVTLLQLRDGSMYGLTRYWIKGDRLHYVTDYGGENSVPLDRVDLEKTSELNLQRGTPLNLPISERKP
jgi:hypothetical protein